MAKAKDTPQPNVGKLVEVDIKDEMRRSFIDYAMSVIVSRALPDARDGLKPVHRRILFAMNELGLTPDKPYKKCARIVGEVLGKYHPHGDTAVYEALVRLAQPFSSRYPLIDGHGNFGSLDDGPAAMRYTEARLTGLSIEILSDIDFETVDFVDNFDGSLKEPVILPSKVPTLLLNGSSGIAVGMATNIPPHNLGEVIDGVIALIDNSDINTEGLMQYIKGPDFPSGGQIMGVSGIKEAYETGRGSIAVRGHVSIEEVPSSSGRGMVTGIVVTELPYLVGPEVLINKIADLVKDEKITGIADLNDESGRDGLRVVVKLKRDAKPDVVLNNLYKHTQIQETFSVNTLALIGKQPKTLSLKELLNEFVEHRVEVITRKCKFELGKAEARVHILEGLLIALENIDAIIKLVRGAEDTDKAKEALIKKFSLDDLQASAILEMQLRRLTGLEREKIEKENKELNKRIKELKKILSQRQLILDIAKQELTEIKKKYANPRRTKIVAAAEEFKEEDLIPNERMVVFLTERGYIKRIPLTKFERQNRATRGKGGIKTREEDAVEHFLIANMHDTLLFFTQGGSVFSSKVYDVVEGSMQHKGQAMYNLISISQEDKVTAIYAPSEFKQDNYFVMLTKQGIVKKISMDNFESVRRSGIVAMNLDEGDQLGWVRRSYGKDHIIIGTYDGMVLRFNEEDLRPLGRTARGVRAINLREGDYVVGFDTFAADSKDQVLLVTTDGFGKRVELEEFRTQNRAGVGLIGTKFKSESSHLASLDVVKETDEVIIASAHGVVLRAKVSDISCQSRMATGVRLQKLDEEDYVASVTKHTEEESKVSEDTEPVETK
ncbi:MAG: DNA gyrase subunit A [Candidatus Melainabacteria bacterium]|nr:DNA gyrase subunit A [Candidatus Melainabacteria bacterium]